MKEMKRIIIYLFFFIIICSFICLFSNHVEGLVIPQSHLKENLFDHLNKFYEK